VGAKRGRWTVIAVVWLVTVASGMALLIEHQSAAGEAALAPTRWPDPSPLRRAAGMPTLVMLAHPLCPCTRASLAELARLMPQVSGRIEAHVLFLDPDSADERWHDSNLRRIAAAIPGVQVHDDHRGEAARAFGSATSGQTLLYDANGVLQFAGGITPGRGHEGDTIGRDTIAAHVLGAEDGLVTTPVFGCALRTPDEIHLAETNQ
jgi:hypothetical protein